MAILSNINGKFAVESTGAIKFNGQVGTSGYILKSNGNSSPTWVDPDTVIGGPYLPLTGGTLTGNLAISGSNSLTVGGALTVGGNNVVGFSGSWNGANMPGSRWNGYAVNGGEIVFQRDNPNSGQMSILVDGGYYAGENNGFYSLYSANSYNSKAGFYADTSGVLQFNASATFAGNVNISKNGAVLRVTDGNITNTSFNTLVFAAPAQNKFALGVSSTTGFAQNITIDGATANVGIGTTSPSSYNSRGRNLVLSGSGDVGISIDCSSANSGTLLFADGTGGTAAYRGSIEYDHANDSMVFSTAATEKIRITSAGNVGIGSTLPDAKLEVVQPSGDGAAGTPTLMLSNDPTGQTGYTWQSWRYNENNSNYRLDLKQRVTSGVVRYSFNMVNNGVGFNDVLVLDRGQVGIGTTSPTAPLTIAGSGADGNAMLRLEATAGSQTFNWISSAVYPNLGVGKTAIKLFGQAQGSNNQAYIGFKYAGSGSVNNTLTFGFYANNFLVNLLANGNFGIGTTSPVNPLHIKAAQGGMFRIEDSSGNIGAYTEFSGGYAYQYYYQLGGGVKIALQTNGNSYFNGGNVGIGTTIPSCGTIGGTPLLHAYNNTNGARPTIHVSCHDLDEAALLLSENSGGGGNWGARLYYEGSGDNFFNIQTVDSGSVRNPAFSINRYGRTALGFNTANPAPQSLVQIGASFNQNLIFTNRINASPFSLRSNGSSIFQTNTGANAAGIMLMGNNGQGWNAIEFYHKNTSVSQAYVGRISTNSSSTSYVTSSDYRLKENVIPMSDSISRINQLKPSKFNFIIDPEITVDGFLAHEVQDIVPEAIVGDKDEIDEEGNPVYQGIDQAKLVPLLVAAVQELEARVKELENK